MGKRFCVDVGDMPEKEAKEFVKHLKTTFKTGGKLVTEAFKSFKISVSEDIVEEETKEDE